MRNPYDRRRGGDQANTEMRGSEMRGATHSAGYAMVGMPRPEQPRALAIEDLDALAFSARARGEQAASDRLTERFGEQLRQVSREAWDDGHTIGVDEGRHALLDDIETQFDAKARAGRDTAWRVLLLLKENPKRVSRQELAEALTAAADVLDELITAHHASFSQDLPF